MTLKLKNLTLATAVAGVLAAAPSQAAIDTTYNAGDLILGFQNTATSQFLEVNLGAATIYRDATSNILNIANLNTLLTTLNGGAGGWFDNSSIYFGIAGVRSSSGTNNSGTFTGATGVNDPNQTTYFTKSRASVGTAGTANSDATNSGSAASASPISTMGAAFNTGSGATGIFAGAFGTNTWDAFNPIGGTAFSGMPGGIQQAFANGSFGNVPGLGAVEGEVDLWRDPSFANTSVTPQYAAGVESFVGSFTIDNGGNVSFLTASVPEPSTALLGMIGSAFMAGFSRRRKQLAA